MVSVAPMASAVYEGRVTHTRSWPRAHTLCMPLFMMYLDLSELDRVFQGRWLWSTRGANLAWMRREDYLGPAGQPLAESVRQAVRDRLAFEPRGPIRMLTHLRYMGYAFNPVSFYYCFDAGAERVEAVVAEITNTPWGERHAYVLDARKTGLGRLTFELDKTFHVSPFMEMSQRYLWRFSHPGKTLAVHMENEQLVEGARRRIFSATLALAQRPLSGPVLAGVLMRYPAMTLQVIARIYVHALALKLKGVPHVPHPPVPATMKRGTGHPVGVSRP